jgi:hypothetical protein
VPGGMPPRTPDKCSGARMHHPSHSLCACPAEEEGIHAAAAAAATTEVSSRRFFFHDNRLDFSMPDNYGYAQLFGCTVISRTSSLPPPPSTPVPTIQWSDTCPL